MSPKKKTRPQLNVRMPYEEDRQAIDAAAKRHGVSPSEWARLTLVAVATGRCPLCGRGKIHKH